MNLANDSRSYDKISTGSKTAEREGTIQNEARLESLLRIISYPATNIQDFLDFALEEAIALTGSKIGYIYYYSEKSEEFTLNTWSKEVMHQCSVNEKQTMYQLSKTGIWGEAVRQRRAIVINDFAAPNPLKKGIPNGHAPLHRFLTIPVIPKNEIVAVVGVANKIDEYDNSDIRQLTLMMDSVWKVVQRKKAEEESQKNEAMLKAVGKMAKVGGWELDVATMSLTWTDMVYEIHEVELEFIPTVEQAIDFYSPEARPIISLAVQSAIANGTPFDLELPIITAKGARRFVHALGEARQSNGKTITVFGTFQDISERKLADNELKLAHTKLDAFWNIALLKNAKIKTICDHVLESIVKMTDSKFGFYGFINEDETVMTIHSWSGEAMKGCSMVEKPSDFSIAEAGIWGEAVRQRKAVIINDYSAPHKAKKGLPEGHVPLNNLMVVPVFSRGKITSVAAVANRDTAYTESDAKHLSAFSEAIQEIIERKQTEEALQNSQLLLQACIESPKDMIIMAVDREYRYLCFNSAHKASMKYAYGKDIEIGMNILDCITSEEDRKKAKANYDKAMAGESYSSIEVFGDVNKSYYESFYNPILNDRKEIAGITAYAIDITSRKQAELKLFESEEKYSSLFNTMLEGFALHEIICDDNGKPVDYRFLDMNPAFERFTGLKKADTLGKTILEIMPAIESSWIEKYGNVALTGEPISFENYTSSLDQHYQVIAFCPKKHQFAVIFTEITERKKAEDAISAEKERLAVTLRSIGDGVITTDTMGNIVIMNKVAEDLCGWKQEEAQGKSLTLVFNIINQSTRLPHENPVEKVLSTGQIIELANHTLLISRDGTERIIADSGAPIKDKTSKTIGVVLVFRDMTEKHKLLDNMQRIDKLDSLGVLAGGIAHDFNNLLSGIFGYLDMARERTTNDKTVSKYLDKALGVFERAKDLTQQLLTFSKGGAPKRKTGHIGKLVKENAAFVLSGSNVSCEYRIAEDLWLCDYDENQIGQVIDNIILNAQQAMPVGGTIMVSVNNISLEDNASLTLKAGNYIKISIADTGVGIPQDLLKRIFDPFFTTKQKGNGLGLATCYSIVQKHDGSIDVESVPGKGSIFHIYLPAIHTGSIQDVPQTTTQHKGQGSILIMDDEDFMRETVGDMLTMMGYTLIEAENGEDALRLCAETKKQGTPLRAALFDLTIPGAMGGKEAIRKLREDFPDLLVFASSGFSEDPIMARPTDFGFTDSIRKPFRKAELSELLERYLSTPK